MSDIIIRNAVSGDETTILRLIRELAAYEKLEHEVVATPAMLAERLFCPDPKAFCVLAEDNDKAIGFSLFFYNFSTFLGRHGIYIEDIYVSPDARGSGTGRKIMRHICQKAVSEGCGRVEWWVLNWNDPAIEFYKKISAKPMDEWTTFRLTGDALQDMAK